MVILDGTITIVALPSIGADLSFSEQGLQWVLSAYALTFGGLLLLGGRAADLLGRRRVFIAGVLLFTVASLGCGLAWSPEALLSARIVQGVGAAIMTPTALSIISTTFSEGSERNKALGLWGALGGIGATAAWLVGGPLVDGPGWRWIFFIGGRSWIVLSPLLLGESRAALTRRSYDPVGALTITGAFVLLVYAVVEAPTVGWAEIRTIVPLVGSAVLIAAFALIESRHHAPLVPLRLLCSRTLAGANAVTVFIGTVGVGVPFVLTLYARRRCSATLGPRVRHQLGGAAIAATVGAIAGQNRVLKDRLPRSQRAACGVHGRRVACPSPVSVPGSYFRSSFSGCSCAVRDRLAFVTSTVAALAGVADHESGLASGLSNTALQIGSALGVAIVTTVAVSRSHDYQATNAHANPAVALTEGFQSAFVACAVLAAIGMALALLLLGRPRKAARELPEPVLAVSASD
jgi:MFS family permease